MIAYTPARIAHIARTSRNVQGRPTVQRSVSTGNWAYYNENNPFSAEWLKNLIAGGKLPAGDVDTRSIKDVQPDDLIGYTQCHFFAGIGGWPLALRLSDWPKGKEVWTGSCPCQPFSVAGKGGGFTDDRHLWPYWFKLIAARRPGVVFGEQSSSKDALTWLDLVQSDLEEADYTSWAVDFGAASVGAPHIRQRLYFVADTSGKRIRTSGPNKVDATAHGMQEQNREWERIQIDTGEHSANDCVADSANTRRDDEGQYRSGPSSFSARSEQCSAVGYVADASDKRREQGRAGKESAESRCASDRVGNSTRTGLEERRRESGDDGQECTPVERTGGSVSQLADSNPTKRRADMDGRHEPNRHSARPVKSNGQLREHCQVNWPGPTNGFWQAADWLHCTDNKWRPVEPGTFPLAHGVPARVGRLSAYGNAVVIPQVVEFINTYIDMTNGAIDVCLE